MKIFSIDTGSKISGYCIFDGTQIYAKGVVKNDELLTLIPLMDWDICLIEMFNLYMVDLSANNPTKSGKKIMGTRFGLENLTTIIWIGRFMQEATATNKPTHLIRRDTIKVHFFSHTRIKSSDADKGIRNAIIERFGAKGRKTSKGVLYGVTSHIWSALALSVYWLETENPKTVKL